MGLMNKNKLEIKTAATIKKYKKLVAIKNNIERFGGICIFGTMIPGALISKLNILMFISLISAIITLMYCTHISNKINNVKKEYKNIKNQLDDIISMDFEKKRYELEKKYNDTLCKNDLLKNIEEEKHLLEKYKRDLNDQVIHRIDNELTNEINNRNYILQKLNNLK